MAYNFLACDRDQAFLLPPDVRDWLPADHLAWFILDVVDQLDLDPFLAAYRADGHGRAAYQPRMLLAVLLYGYCTGVRSSRQIERRCREDIAFRVLAGNRIPDHVATLEAQVAELLEQAAEADRAEDQQYGAARGDELPQALAGRAERLARLQHAKAQLEAEAAARQQRYQQRVAELVTAAGPAASDPAPTSDRGGAMRLTTPRRRSTPPTPTAALYAATAASCRATTPRQPPPPPR